jgi:glycosyltransferase involved in cell wall biosynthesis
LLNSDRSSLRPLLFISFFTGIRGNCPAEWADDKLRVLDDVGRKTFVLTGMGSHVTNGTHVRYFRVPSLSWNDFKEEVKELKSEGDRVPPGIYLFMPFAFLFGSIIDWILRAVTRGISAGRWSWIITALPVGLWLKLRHGVMDVFCTGGPTAALVVGCAIARLTRGRLFCEFQDPILGVAMTRSSMTRRISSCIEAWLTSHSYRAVYVTREAARLARERNPKNASQIIGVYPGSWRFLPQVSKDERITGDTFEFFHLGTLYGSRNLDLFFDALDALRKEGFRPAEAVRVVNLGAVYCETATSYLTRPDFHSLEALDRLTAIVRARKASVLMLVQHADDRSQETIPYKTYDYMNIGLPIFGLLKNDELQEIIESAGGYAAKADSFTSIKQTLRSSLSDLVASQVLVSKAASTTNLDISRQFLQVLDGVDGG